MALTAHIPLIISDEFPCTTRRIHITDDEGTIVKVVDAGTHMDVPVGADPEEGQWDTDWEAALDIAGYEVVPDSEPVHNNGGMSFSVYVNRVV